MREEREVGSTCCVVCGCLVSCPSPTLLFVYNPLCIVLRFQQQPAGICAVRIALLSEFLSACEHMESQSGEFLRMLKECSAGPRDLTFLRRKRDRYLWLTHQLHAVIISRYFSKSKLVEMLATKILNMLMTDEYPDEYCPDYKREMDFLSVQRYAARNKLNKNVAPLLIMTDQPIVRLQNFLFYLNIHDYDSALWLCAFHLHEIQHSPIMNTAYSIGNYKYVDNYTMHILFNYYAHCSIFPEPICANLMEFPHNLPIKYFGGWICSKCIGRGIEGVLDNFYCQMMGCAERAAEPSTEHSIYCPLVKRDFPAEQLALPWRACERQVATVKAPPRILGSFGDVIDSVIINRCRRTALCLMCCCLKEWTLDRSRMVTTGSDCNLRNLDVILRTNNNLLVSFSMQMVLDQANGPAEASSAATPWTVDKWKMVGVPRSLPTKMVHRVSQTKHLVFKTKQTQTNFGNPTDNKEINRWKQRASELEGRVNSLKQDKHTSAGRLTSMRNELAKCKGLVKERDAEIKALQAQTTERDAHAKSVAGQVNLLRNELVKVRGTLKERDSEIRTLNQKVAAETLRHSAELEKKNAMFQSELGKLHEQQEKLGIYASRMEATNLELRTMLDDQQTLADDRAALKTELERMRDAYYRVSTESNKLKDQMAALHENDRKQVTEYVREISNDLKALLRQADTSCAEAFQRFEHRGLMVVTEYELETSTTQDFAFPDQADDLRKQLRDFQVFLKRAGDLLHRGKLQEAIRLFDVPTIVKALERCPSVLFDDISKMITKLADMKQARRVDAAEEADRSPTSSSASPDPGQPAPEAWLRRKGKLKGDCNEFTDAHGKYHLLFMRVKENVFNAESDDIIVQALKEVRRKNNDRMSFLTYEQIVNRVQEHIDECTESNSCCICFHNFNKYSIRVLTCNHKFHERCIDRWFETNNVCPICRSVISP